MQSCPSRSASPAAITSSASSCSVTMRGIDIKSDNKDAYDQLSLELTAKTYRYMDEDEIAAGEADKKKDVTHRPKPAGAG